MFAFCNRIFSALVPVCADINFLKSYTVSVGQHLIRCFFPNRSLATTSMRTGAYELWTNLPYLTRSITFTYFVTGKNFGLYSIIKRYIHFGYPHFEQVLVFKLKVSYLHRRQFTWVLYSWTAICYGFYSYFITYVFLVFAYTIEDWGRLYFWGLGEGELWCF